MKKLLLTLALAGIFAGVQAQDGKNSAAAPSQVDNKNAADFKFEVEEYNFGSIKQGEKVTYDFNFTNVGKEPLIITAANGSCGCTVPSYPKEPIGKSGKGVIHVEFNSAGKMGMQDKTVTLTSNSKSGAKVLHLKGNVEAPAPAPASDSPAPASK
ncbi:MAG: DUF1573 domain-containing protein [Bacteroidota bacterium]